MLETKNRLTTFEKSLRKKDSLFKRYAKHVGHSECELWTLYEVYTKNGLITKPMLVSEGLYSKQTLQNAIKRLEDKGIIYLKTLDGKKRLQGVYLTDLGLRYTSKIIVPFISAQIDSFMRLSVEEQTLLNKLVEEKVSILEERMRGLFKTDAVS